MKLQGRERARMIAHARKECAPLLDKVEHQRYHGLEAQKEVAPAAHLHTTQRLLCDDLVPQKLHGRLFERQVSLETAGWDRAGTREKGGLNEFHLHHPGLRMGASSTETHDHLRK